MSLTTLTSKSRVTGISGALLLLALALHILGGADLATARDVVLIIASVIAGVPIAISAWQALRYKQFSIDLLVTIAVGGALIIGEYTESAVVSFLFVFGSFLELRTMEKTRRSLRELVDLAPQEAEVVRADGTVVVPVDEVEVGERVVVRIGGRVPVDGTVVHGHGTVDEATITGEPLAVTKEDGDQVWSGTVVESGYLELRADRVGEDTTFAQIIELVEEAQDSKARTQKFLDRFAAWYTPAIVVASVLALVITRDIRFALTFLVIACPGALVISTPVSLVAGMGNAARHGALIKGGDALEKLARVDTLVLDKTGTITQGKPEVTDIVMASDAYSENELLRLVGSLEQASEHPLGRTLVKATTERGLELTASPAGVEVVTGGGIRGLVSEGGRTWAVAVGSERLLTELGYAVPDSLAQRALALEQAGSTVSWVVIDDAVAGLVAITDQVRPEAREAIAALRRKGIEHFVLLTGDNAHTAGAVAAQVGIDGPQDHVAAQLLPQDKVAEVQRLRDTGRRVAMIGDGINDAPAIATADVGLAMGGGTDVSLQTADVVLVGSRFDQLLQARTISRATLWNMAQNTAIALGTVVILLAGVVGGVVHMASGMLVHEISVLVVILNAMRLIRRRDKDAARIAATPSAVPRKARESVHVG
ncbi:MAG TPA: cadmium-translocating P-type ATPase [Intrasporangiaceae bacterium]|nr:cadmium-translocating P-type ATPase [Intrasporangiaceae bacterium]